MSIRLDRDVVTAIIDGPTAPAVLDLVTHVVMAADELDLSTTMAADREARAEMARALRALREWPS